MTESPVDVAAIKAEHPCNERHFCFGVMLTDDQGCLPYRLAEALDRAQAASEGVDLLIAQAERRGAVKALRAFAEGLTEIDAVPFDVYAQERADAIENGADL